MKKLLVLSALLLALVVSACSENSVSPADSNSVNSDILIKNTATMANGISYRALESIGTPGIEWEVIVTMPNGALVKYSYAGTGQLREVKGLSGPFDYELSVGTAYVSYSYARKSALKSVFGNITAWKFHLDESSNRFEFRFWITKDSGSYELRLDAVTGDVLRIKN